MRFLRTFATVACTVVVVAAPAAAQDPGVFIDPESPTAKEYALPLENERRLADPSTPSDAAIPQGRHVSPAFGEGIRGGSDRSASGGNSAPGTAGGESASSGGSDADRAAAATVRAATANPGAPGGDVGDTLVIAGVALAVLVLAAGAGLVLRRRRA